MNTSLAYEEKYKSELINGQVIMMSPPPVSNHFLVAGNIYLLFANYLKGKRCTPYFDGFDLHLTDKDCFEPDFMIVCDPNKIKYNGVFGAADLVVEVLSPSTAKRDRGYKKDVYEQCGVKEYWLVDINSKAVEQYILQDNKFMLHEIYTMYPDYMLADMTDEERANIPTEFKCSLYDDLTITLADIFARVI